MTELGLTEEQQVYQRRARDFVEREIKPIAVDLDRNPTDQYNWNNAIWAILKKLAENGLLWLNIQKEYGGHKLDTLTTAMIVEELAVGDAGVAFTAIQTFSHPAQGGTEEQKNRFLSSFCDKEKPKIAAFCITEAGAGSDAAAMATRARLEGNEYVINGTKRFISGGGIASIYAVYATVDKTKGARGITAFLVPGNTPGLSASKVEDKMGFRAIHTGELILDNVRVPKQNLLGEEGKGFAIAMRDLDLARLLGTGAISLGIARAAYETALGYLKETPERARAALAQQLTSFTLADMAAWIKACRFMVWEGCRQVDANLSITSHSSMAKFLCSDMAMKVVNQAFQLLGLYGYLKQYPLEKYMRDAKLLQIYEGTNEINRMIVAREILAR